jgi:hypothetical protein
MVSELVAAAHRVLVEVEQIALWFNYCEDEINFHLKMRRIWDSSFGFSKSLSPYWD